MTSFPSRPCACRPSSCWSSQTVWGITPTPWTTCSDWRPGQSASSVEQILPADGWLKSVLSYPYLLCIPEIYLTISCLPAQVCPKEPRHFTQQQHHCSHHPVRHCCHVTGPPRRQLQRHEVCPRPGPHGGCQRRESKTVKPLRQFRPELSVCVTDIINFKWY